MACLLDSTAEQLGDDGLRRIADRLPVLEGKLSSSRGALDAKKARPAPG